MKRTVNPLAHVTEKPTQRALLQWLRLVLPPGSIVSATMNESGGAKSTDPHARARYFEARKASGVVGGWPDLTCAIPPARVVFLETKRPVGGVLSEAQQEIHARLRAMGHHVGVVTGPESALVVLQAAGVPLRNVGNMQAVPAVVRLARSTKLVADPVPI